MRKLVLLLALAGSSAFFGGGGAIAQSIEGQWMNNGSAMGGASYTLSVFFAPNGAFQYQMAINATRQMPNAGGVTSCQGSYQFDGQYVQTAGNCQVCGSGGLCGPGPALQFGGPVQFMNEYTINIGGDIFRRQ